MKKFISALLAGLIFLFPILLTGCAEKHEDIDEYKWAEFDKYNSYASENGLDGDKIYISGKMSTVVSDNDENEDIHIFHCFVTQKDKNVWISAGTVEDGQHLNSEEFDDTFGDQEVIVCGQYLGYSDVHKHPTLLIEKIILEEKNYTIKDFCEKDSNIEVLFTSEVQFDEYNTINLSFGKNIKTDDMECIALCSFDGVEPEVGFRRIVALAAAVGNIVDKTSIMVQYGEEVGLYVYENGELNKASLPVSSFNSIDTSQMDSSLAQKEVMLILETISSDTDKIK